MQRKRFFFFSVLSLLSWCFVPQAWAQTKQQIGDLYYLLYSDGTATVTYKEDTEPNSSHVNAYTGDIVIPETVVYNETTYKVTKIGKQAFSYSSVNNLVIGNNVTTLEGDAIAYIGTTLKTVTFGKNFTTAAQGVMYSSKPTDLYFYSFTPPTSISAYFVSGKPKAHIINYCQEDWNTSSISNFISSYVDDVDFAFDYSDLQKAISICSADYSVTGTTPGCFVETIAPQMSSALTNAQSLTESSSEAEIDAAVRSIMNLKNQVLIKIEEGYYTFISDNHNIADNKKTEKAMYINADVNQVYWGEYDPSSVAFVFKVTANGRGFNLQSVENNLYTSGGSGNSCAVIPAVSSPVYPIYINYWPGTGSFYIKANGWCYCPQGNPGGTSDGPSYLWAWNGESDGAHCEVAWRAIKLTEEHVNQLILTSGLPSMIASATHTQYEAGSEPNQFTQASIDAYNALVDEAKAMDLETATLEQKYDMYERLSDINSLIQVNPITEGYYYITTAGNGPGYSGGPYNYEDKSALYNEGGIVKWKAYDQTDASQIYKFTPAADGKWNVYSVKDKTYIKRGKEYESYQCDVLTTKTAEVAQEFGAVTAGSGKFWMKGGKYVYAMINSHNGTSAASGNLSIWGTTTEAFDFKINIWYLHAVPQDIVEALDALIVEDGDAQMELTGSLSLPQFKVALGMVDKESINTVDLSSTDVTVAAINPSDLANAGLSANTIFYMPNAYGATGPNIVVDGNCALLNLTDKVSFAPLSTKPFTAQQAVYNKTLVGGSGWYSCVLPFDYIIASGIEVLTNATVNETTVSFESKAEGETIPAGTPFLYNKDYSGSIALTATAATISTSAGTSGDLKGTFTVIPTEETVGKMVLNADGSAFAKAVTGAWIPAFRAYLDAPAAGSATFSIVIDDELSGILTADADLNAKVDVYTLDGKLLRQQVEALTALQGLENGIYVINGKKIKK